MKTNYIKYRKGTLERVWTKLGAGKYAWADYRVKKLKSMWGCYYQGLCLGHCSSMKEAKDCAENHDSYNFNMTCAMFGIY